MQPTKLHAPVGLRWRKQQVANLQQDQAAIVDLLWKIPLSQGGMKDSQLAPFLTGPHGDCPSVLADAIWKFQSHWKKAGQFRNIDGVVDPGMNTLRMMNALANGQKVAPAGPGAPIPISPSTSELPLPPTPAALRALGLYLTHWSIASGGASLSISVEVAGAAAARIALNKQGEPSPHHYHFTGASTGFGPVSFGFNFAPPSLWSAGSRVAARSPLLDADDFRGPCSIITGSSNFFAGIPDGATASLIAFGARLGNNVFTIPRQIRSARALAATMGLFKGADISLSIAAGHVS